MEGADANKHENRAEVTNHILHYTTHTHTIYNTYYIYDGYVFVVKEYRKGTIM